MGMPKDPEKRAAFLAKLRENGLKAAAALRGKPHPNAGKPRGPMKQETKDNISKAKTGKPNPAASYPCPEERREKISNALAGKSFLGSEQREAISKSLTGRVRNDIRDSKLAANGTGDYLWWRDDPRYKVWRFAVYERDNSTCQKCGKTNLKGRGRHAHHLKDGDEFPEFRFEVSNGETLCTRCHYLTHNPS